MRLILLNPSSILFSQLQPSDASIHTGRVKSIREAKSWRPAMHSNASAIQGSLDNFIATGGFNPSAGSGGGSSSLLGDPTRPLGGGNDSDHWNGLANGGGTRRGGGATELNDDPDDKRDFWMSENDTETDDSGEFQVSYMLNLNPIPSDIFIRNDVLTFFSFPTTKNWISAQL